MKSDPIEQHFTVFFFTIRDTNLLFGVRVSMKSSQNIAASVAWFESSKAMQRGTTKNGNNGYDSLYYFERESAESDYTSSDTRTEEEQS